MATKKPAKKMTNIQKMEIGAGIAAAAVAVGAAGYYFYGAEHAKQHRKATAKWAADLKKDVLRNAKKVKQINAATIAAIVDESAAAYQGVRGAAPEEIRSAAQELKKNWLLLKEELAGPAKKSVRKVAKKSS